MPQSVSFLGFPDWGSVHSLSVVETNYAEYALLFSRGTKGPGQDFRMATLYSRYPNPQAQHRGMTVVGNRPRPDPKDITKGCGAG